MRWSAQVLHYTELPSKGATTTPNDWPEASVIEFRDVEMAYRPGLPAVLKGVSFAIKPGEKVRVSHSRVPRWDDWRLRNS